MLGINDSEVNGSMHSFCKSSDMSTQPCELAPLVPFPEGTLSLEHRQEIAKIRSSLQAWLKTIEHARKRPGEKERTAEAMNILSSK